MFTSAIVVVGLLLTLVLPIYPKGLDPLIAAFLGLTGVAAALGLLRRPARRELVMLSPWAGIMLVAILVGSFRNGEALQAVEDSLPYALFVLGLAAGRGMKAPRAALVVTLWVCVIDSAVSLSLMPSFEAGMRSTYNYYKITAGLPLVGLYLIALLRHTDPSGRAPYLIGRPIFMGMGVLLLVGLVASVSRGMMLGLMIGVFIAAYIRKPSQVTLASIIVCIGLIIYSSTFAELGQKYLRFSASGTIEGRFREVETAWTTFMNYPLFGAGLGATFEVDGFQKAFVHNMVAYHLWKFGLVGSAALAMPLLVIGRQLRYSPRNLRAIAVGGALSVIAYLVTCAAYKTYYLVWIYGVVSGASLSWLAAWRWRTARHQMSSPIEPADPAVPGSVGSASGSVGSTSGSVGSASGSVGSASGSIDAASGTVDSASDSVASPKSTDLPTQPTEPSTPQHS